MAEEVLIPYDDATRKTLLERDKLPPIKGTYFFGGAGFNGAYIEDMIQALRDAGISHVRAGHNKESVGRSMFGTSAGGYPAMLTDAAAVTALNQAGYYLVIMKQEFPEGGQQFNLIGYSYGCIIAAVKANSYAKVYNGTVDHVVLIGAPIEASLVKELKSNKNIRKVIIVNLKEQGDPIYAGMTDFELISSVSELGDQMMSQSGHFYYAPMTPDGSARRRKLAKYLYDQGLR